MPRTVYGAAARAAEAEKAKEKKQASHRETVARIIRAEAAMQGLRTDKSIAQAVGLGMDTFRKTMNGDVMWTLEKLMAVCDGLGLNNETRAAILGGRT